MMYEGNSKEVLKQFEDNYFDSIVTDPPYELAFMGKKWDASGIAYDIELWQECLRVLKPGGHLLAFGGTRTYHRMTCAIEDAGFEIRDSIDWVYGSGFPKSMDIGKKLDDWEGWGTALKPAHEPIVMARKPLAEKTVAANVLEWGTGGLNIDECRIGSDGGCRSSTPFNGVLNYSNTFGPNLNSQRSPKVEGLGRWPANLVHDGSEEVLQEFAKNTSTNVARFFKECPADIPSIIYQSKTSRKERGGSTHPTIKPLSLISYLVRMVTPPGGIVLDPFLGSGTLGLAAEAEGMRWVGIDLDLTEAKRRIDV